MSRILVTGSNDGIGAEIARVLTAQGHDVIRHARSAERADGSQYVVGELSSLGSTREMAADVLRLGAPEVVVHNAGWGSKDESRPVTEDGFEKTFQINALAPLLLTALLPKPRRIVFVSSDSIVRGRIRLDDLQHEQEWSQDAAYADSKLAMTALAFALARRWPEVFSNAVHPGWVSTKMSGYAAPLTVAQGADTPAWLAVSDEPAALVTGAFFQDRKAIEVNPQAYDPWLQDALLARCLELCSAELD
ncbi:SDR family NAD(P)-dependent oxidoreductase [Kribbella sp. NBC_00709]|uniref:SDR family NAD(P)-dependent oxidoreductase n=1 Tax=Kribbella sp. NBC_00709 TaxID=2975972 RepID=UPI002E2804B6|nr:SDR family NAD(P)-dependent oxidoreductase [Kribbella sp. NBC_00709]